ncbi:MAG: associated Golgi protein-related protein [Solirubrobacteraceae bacterium]|nr:associated Golgi protein-related protein [Solirubrobacteraceae bacterium]
MLVLASVTDSLVTFATHVIRDLGLGGVFLLVAADALGIPIAAAAIMLFAGFDVSTGHLTLLGVIVAGTLGDVAGSLIAYAIGATGGHELLERHGRKLHITPAKLATAHRWFDERGSLVIAVGRLVPFVRTYIAYPAGVARMDLRRFVAATFAGGAVLSIVWTLVGKAVGHNWTKWKHALGYVDYAVVALVLLAAAYLLVRWYRSRGAPADAAT